MHGSNVNKKKDNGLHMGRFNLDKEQGKQKIAEPIHSENTVVCDCSKVNLHHHSFLLIDEQAQILKVLSNETDQFLPGNSDDFSHAFIELEAVTNQNKLIHILFIRPIGQSKLSGHEFLYMAGMRIITQFKEELDIKEIKPKEIYAVTGECKSNIKMVDFAQEIPVYLADLKVYFNTKGTLSDKYKPLAKYARKNMSEEECDMLLQQYKDPKMQHLFGSHQAKALRTFIPACNWHFDPFWDFGVLLECPMEAKGAHTHNTFDSSHIFFKTAPTLEEAGSKEHEMDEIAAGIGCL